MRRSGNLHKNKNKNKNRNNDKNTTRHHPYSYPPLQPARQQAQVLNTSILRHSRAKRLDGRAALRSQLTSTAQ